MIIGICGIKRSGSTCQFNMVRLILEHAGLRYKTWGTEFSAGRMKKGNHIVKIHKPHRWLYDNADHIFTTDRSDEEIWKSLQRFAGATDKSRLKKMREDLEWWNNHPESNRVCKRQYPGYGC